MSDEEERRQPVSDCERSILLPAMMRFHQLPPQSRHRSEIIQDVLQRLSNPSRWTARRVRLFFNNNRHENVATPDMQSYARPSPTMATFPSHMGFGPILSSPQVATFATYTTFTPMPASPPAVTFATYTTFRPLPASPPIAAVAPAAVNHGPGIDSFVDLFARKNFPISLVGDHVLCHFLHDLNPFIQIPTVSQLRVAIIDRANRIRSAFTPESQSSRYVNLLADGIRKIGHIWLGVCLYIEQKFHFWRILEMPNQTANSIAERLAEVVRELNAKGFIVTSVVTDNASSEKSALNEEHISSVQRLTGVFVFRTPCLSHSANLALQECFHDCFPSRNIYSDMQKIYDSLPHAHVRDDFYGFPSIVKTRWFSVGQFVDSVSRNYPKVYDTLRDKPIHEILEIYNFTALSRCCHIVNSLIQWSESETGLLANVWIKFQSMLNQFQILINQHNQYAHIFKVAFFRKLMAVEDISQIMFSFLCTRRGLNWFRSLPDEDEIYFSKHQVLDTINILKQHLVITLGANEKQFDVILWHYLTEETFPDHLFPEAFWESKRSITVTATVDGVNRQVPYFFLCEVAARLVRLPCSEAAVERAFSHLRLICGDNRHSLKPDLVDALLVTRLHCESPRGADAQVFCYSLEQVDSASFAETPVSRFALGPEIRTRLIDFAIRHPSNPNQLPPHQFPHHRWGEQEIGRRLQGMNPTK
jgi:hypothetical protein